MAQSTREGPAPAEHAKPHNAPSESDPASRLLPPYRVLLHNDDVNEILDVVDAVVDTTPLGRAQASEVALEAHMQGVALVLTTHHELAELYEDRLSSRGLTVTIEPAR